ncbi:MAG: TPM domain-containing protein [Chitinophagaceae bacterium]|nr:TPM domain-containing protein [Chitinophagaceae bacterium]
MKQFLLFILCYISLAVNAQVDKYIPPAPNPPKLVNDFTGTLTALQAERLEHKLKNYDDTSSNQIAVVIVETLHDYDPYEFATTLGRQWGVGNKAFNNGVVFLIATKDRKVFIAPGYGLEGALPDITCKQIIENEVLPNFRGNDYYRGIEEGTDAIMKAAAGEYQPPAGYADRGKTKGVPVGVVILVIIVIVIIVSRMGGGGGGSFMSRRGYRETGVPPIFWFPSGGGGSRSGGGGWSGGGSGGGGFGGFGGGSFGGGGAGGSW